MSMQDKNTKSIRIITVINPEAELPTVYSARCLGTRACKDDVLRAISAIDVNVSDSEIEDIVFAIKWGNPYWLNETYCFESYTI